MKRVRAADRPISDNSACEAARPARRRGIMGKYGWGGELRVRINSHRGDCRPRPCLFRYSPQRTRAGAASGCIATDSDKLNECVPRRIDQIRLKRVFGRGGSRRQTVSIRRGTTTPAA